MSKPIRTSMLAGMLLILSGASDAPDPATSRWLQSRVDRILVAAGQDVPIPIVISSGKELAPESRGPLQVPEAMIKLAPTTQALDGLLAMLLSFHLGEDPPRKGGLAPTIAAAALLAATGGTTDAAEGKNVKTIPLGDFTSATSRRGGRTALSLRGLRWNTLAGNCVTSQIAFLRLIGSPEAPTTSKSTTAWPGSQFARVVIRDLGMEAYPRLETCDETRLPDFIHVTKNIVSGSDR